MSIIHPPRYSQICVVHGRWRTLFLSSQRCRCHNGPHHRDGSGVLHHKNACLNENVILLSCPQLERVFCLLEPRPFSSYRSTKGLVSRRQKSRSRFGKGARILHTVQVQYERRKTNSCHGKRMCLSNHFG